MLEAEELLEDEEKLVVVDTDATDGVVVVDSLDVAVRGGELSSRVVLAVVDDSSDTVTELSELESIEAVDDVGKVAGELVVEDSGETLLLLV